MPFAPRPVASCLRQGLACCPPTPSLQSPGSPTGHFHAVHQRAAPDISLPHRGREVRPVLRASVHKCTDAGTARIRPTLSQIVPREKRLSGRRVRSASCCIIMISDRDIAFSVSEKPSWDKRPRMRSKMSPLFTISVESFPAAEALPFPALRRSEDPLVPFSSVGAGQSRSNPHRSRKHRGCRYAAPRCPQLRIHEIFVISSTSRDRLRISVAAFDPSKNILSSNVNTIQPQDCIAKPLGQPEQLSCVTPSPERG